jgi:hypothetical protein
VPVDEVAALLRRWREAGPVWSRGRVLLDAAQLAGRLTPEERRQVAATLADNGAPDLARQLEARTGYGVDAQHLQAFADGLLELEGPRLDQVIGALETADQRLTAPEHPPTRTEPDPAPPPVGEPAAPEERPPGPEDTLPPPPPGRRSAVGPEDEALDERLRDLAALEHLGDEELQGIRLGEIELGDLELGGQDLGEVALGETALGETTLGEAPLGGAELGTAPAIATGVAAAAAAAGYRPEVDALAADDGDAGEDRTANDGVEVASEDGAGQGDAGKDGDAGHATGEDGDAGHAMGEDHAADDVDADDAAPERHEDADASPADEPALEAHPPRESGPSPAAPADGSDDVAIVPAVAAPTELAPETTAAALARLTERLDDARTASARLTALSPDATGDLDAAAALLLLERFPAGWQRRRAARRLLEVGALAGVDPAELLAGFPDARDRRFVASDLLATSELTAEDLAALLPPPDVRRLAIRAER